MFSPTWIPAAAAIATAGGAVFNSWLFWRLRAALLEQKAEILDECDKRYLRKDACVVVSPAPRHA